MFSLSNFGRKLYVIFFVFMLAACALLAYCFITCIFFDEIGRRKHSLPMIMMTVYVIVYFRYMDLSIYVVTIAASWLQPVDWFDLYACLLLLLLFLLSLCNTIKILRLILGAVKFCRFFYCIRKIWRYAILNVWVCLPNIFEILFIECPNIKYGLCVANGNVFLLSASL